MVTRFSILGSEGCFYGANQRQTLFLELLGFFSACRYQLAVTKYQESECFHSSLYNQNHHWAYPMVFEDFIHNNENIEDKVLIQSPSPTSGLVTHQ